MGPLSDEAPLIVILGQTASGKSALAMDLAKRFDGEIIAADSRTIYKGMDIGTAKPCIEDQKKVRHHLIDIITPDEPFTVADFKRLALLAIEDIASRGKVPFMVGGSGLYIDSVIYNFSFRPKSNEMQRGHLQALSIAELQQLIEERGIAMPENRANQRHLIRTLEADGQVPDRERLRPRTLVIGIGVDKEELRSAIIHRAGQMFEDGIIEETKRLSQTYGWGAPALQTPGYKELRMYQAGMVTLEEARHQFIQSHIQYAKRQKTWFKRNKDVHWISNSAEDVDLVTTFLNK
jgi:tRNA dimethylallyltransferase